ncbi:MAG: aminomethyl-transferring glycine dehydrogenase [Hyphomicrobiales bacterium]
MITNNFTKRHIGPRQSEVKSMLDKIGVTSIDELIEKTIPAAIRAPKPLNLGEGMNEYEYLNHIKALAAKNKIYRSFIGMGYYNTITPGVITRNILENPGWYTSYTPYQAEISQGRLEALLVYQTMVAELTALPLANASLLDEGTAAAEAMIMFYNSRPRAQAKAGANIFFVDENTFSQTKDVIITRAEPLGIELQFGDFKSFDFNDKVFGCLVQYPNQYGEVIDYREFIEKAHANNTQVAMAADILSLALITPPGELGADVALGTTQRMGIPMGFGGPAAAYFATTDKYKRNMPGRIIGLSKDAAGNDALRMALQTREQHIKRERATSNICTAQALLASMAGMYAAYHGPEGIKEIVKNINAIATTLTKEVAKLGYTQLNENYFDTLRVKIAEGVNIEDIRRIALDNEINFRYINDSEIGISVDETTSFNDVNDILTILAEAAGKKAASVSCDGKCCNIDNLPESLTRTSEYLTHPLFNQYHSETDMMRYLKRLENKDLSLNRSMIPLGSCTMKLNAAVELMPISWPEFAAIHPFVPADQAQGYLELIEEADRSFSEITGFAGMSFQPNSGAAGEYAGLLVIREYLKSKGEGHRNICIIPSSAHGTNPASAVMAGMKTVVTKCDENGNIDVDDLRAKAEEHKDDLAAVMITYPSTHGVFEEGVIDAINIIHENGGQVYMDGANMNAQVGLTSPGFLGADVCHLNLHKTFAIPHGGGGPGIGPIGVAKHLVEFLPGHTVNEIGTENSIHAVASAAFGSAMVLPIAYGYVKIMGGNGLTEATKYAILNANYLRACLEEDYKILYTGTNGFVAHEMIIDCNQYLHSANIPVADIAKRLMDYGFHAPTVAFPVIGTLMVEPTESEPKAELDRFVDAMLKIRKEIAAIENGQADKDNNVVKNAPHTMAMVTTDEWNLPYTRQEAAFPADWAKIDKYWPSVTKIDDAFGDRNLRCVCYMEDYM